MTPERARTIAETWCAWVAANVTAVPRSAELSVEEFRSKVTEFILKVAQEAVDDVDGPSVQPDWCRRLPLQQQSVLFLAGRGPDGTAKTHPCKPVHIAYRGCVFQAAKFGRMLRWGEKADTFMSLDVIASDELWESAVDAFFEHNGSLAHHYLLHFYHGTEILGYKHPNSTIRNRWRDFYVRACDAMHVPPETEEQMDRRLGDWNREVLEPAMTAEMDQAEMDRALERLGRAAHEWAAASRECRTMGRKGGTKIDAAPIERRMRALEELQEAAERYDEVTHGG